MLIIFLVPLWSHSKAVEKTNIQSADSDGTTPNVVKERLNRVITNNIRFSFIALLSAFLGLMGQAIFMWIANDTTGLYEQASLRMWGFFCTSFDNFIGIAAIHAMTTAWLPTQCRRRKSGKLATSVDHQVQTSGNNELRPQVSTDKQEQENSKN